MLKIDSLKIAYPIARLRLVVLRLRAGRTARRYRAQTLEEMQWMAEVVKPCRNENR